MPKSAKMIGPAVRLSIFVLICVSMATDARPPSPPETESTQAPMTTTERPIRRRMVRIHSTWTYPQSGEASFRTSSSGGESYTESYAAEPIRTGDEWQRDNVVSEEEYQRVLDDLRAESERAADSANPDEPGAMSRIEEANRREAENARAQNEGDTNNGKANSEAVIECSVCLSDIERGQYREKLRCGHTFHLNCIDHWFRPQTRPTTRLA